MSKDKLLRCEDCDCCKLGWYKRCPNLYICIGVKEPFAINDIHKPCTAYPGKLKEEKAKLLRCENCTCCVLGFDEPNKYTCVGVKDTFIIDDIHKPCVAYPGELEEEAVKNNDGEIKHALKENTIRPTKDEYYLGIALAVSKRSTCLRRHYGCVIVKDDIIIATGYNGNPRGEENCCDNGKCKRANAERYTGYETCNAVHAEQNALIATSRDKLIGATVYLACEGYDKKWVEDNNPIPCNICKNMLKNAGIIRVVNRSGDVCL